MNARNKSRVYLDVNRVNLFYTVQNAQRAAGGSLDASGAGRGVIAPGKSGRGEPLK